MISKWLTRIYLRRERAHFSEFQFLVDLFQSEKTGALVDVGACHGHLTGMFLKLGWRALAVEPDVKNRAKLLEDLDNQAMLHVDSRAISLKSASSVPFYRSDTSYGISSLNQFHRNHRCVQQVEVTTLTQMLEQYNFQSVDLLKIDAEGEDLNVLKSLDFIKVRPRAIFIEWNNIPEFRERNNPKQIARFIRELGYDLYSFEWHPVIEYGQSHSFKGVRNITKASKFGAKNWGNFLAIDSGVNYINREYERYIDFNLAWDKSISRVIALQERSSKFNNIYIWGRGKGAKRLLQRYPSLRFVSYVESEIRSSEGCFDNRVITPDLIPDRSTVIIASSFQRQIRETLAQFGLFERSKIIFVPFSFLAGGENV